MATSMFDSDSDTEDFLGFSQADLNDSVNQNGESDISFSESDSYSAYSSEESSEDELRGNNNGNNNTWTIDDSEVVCDPFTEDVGPKSELSDEKKAVDFFLLLFPTELLIKIVEETNRYAQQCIETKPDPRWYETTLEEIKAFLALNILFGIKRLPELKMYWSSEPLLGVVEVQKVMSRNRFDKIRQYLHLNDNRNACGQDKLFKIRPLLDIISRTFDEEYLPSQNVSIDEGMIKYKGRLGFKQYMPMKPIKRGIKVWVRADAENGFISEFQVYTGKKDGGPEHGLGYRVVHDLTRKLVGKCYHIFCDNFFTSVSLAKDLLQDKLYLCGTTKASLKEFPKDLKDKQATKSLKRGESLYRRQGNVVATIWKDKKAVAFLSTQCNVKGEGTVRRKQKDGTFIEVPSLPVVTLYNKNMGGVDKSDQMRQYYETSRRASKWWRYLLWFGVDISITNAYILMSLSPNHGKTTQLAFRIDLVKSLLGEFSSRQRNPVQPSLDGGHWPIEMSKGRCKMCLKMKKNTFCRMGCEKCAIRICLKCFKGHA